MGINALMPPMSPPQRYGTTIYDPVWAAAQAHGMVVCFHVGAGMALHGDPCSAPPRARCSGKEALRPSTPRPEPGLCMRTASRGSIPVALDAQELIADLVGGGSRTVSLISTSSSRSSTGTAGRSDGSAGQGLHRGHRAGRVGSVRRYGYLRSQSLDRRSTPHGQALPPQRGLALSLAAQLCIRRQIHCTFQDDPTAVALREYTGVECLLWGSDYPHHEATWPRTLDAVAAHYSGLPETERVAITGGTLAKLFGRAPSSN